MNGRWILGVCFGVWSCVLATEASAQLRDDVSLVREHGRVRVVQSRPAWGGLPLLGSAARWIEVDGRVVVSRSERPSALTLSAMAAPPESPRLDADEVRELAGTSAGTVVELRVRVEGAGLRLTWVLTPAADRQTLERRQIFVDDATGAAWSGPDLTRYIGVSTFARNPALDAEATVLDVATLPDVPRTLSGSQFDVRQCTAPRNGLSCVFAPVAPTDEGDFVFEAPDVSQPADNVDPDDLFAAASVYAHADRFASFAAAHSLQLPCEDTDGPAVLLANYRAFSVDGDILIGNAVYTGDCSLLAVFGQGPGADWGYDGDVVYHELAHGLIDVVRGSEAPLSGLSLRAEAVGADAGAITEAVADFVAAVVSGDPDHAEYAAQFGGGQGRSADNALHCPEGLVGEIHTDSEILAGALWDAYLELDDAWVDVVVDTVAVLPGNASFEEASATLVEVAEAELGEAAAATVEAALAARGLDACQRVVGIEHIRGELWLTPPGPRGRFDPMRPPPFQLALDAPEGRNRARIEFETTVFPDPGWAPVADIDVVARDAEPIAFEFMLLADTQMVGAEITAHYRDADEGSVEIEVVGGETTYVAFFNRGIHVAKLEDFVVSYTSEVDPPTGSSGESSSTSGGDSGGQAPSTSSSATATTPEATGTSDAAGDVQLDDDGGCSCRSSSPRPGPFALTWLLLLSLRARSKAARPRTQSGCRR